jgi:hypothetical protein
MCTPEVPETTLLAISIDYANNFHAGIVHSHFKYPMNKCGFIPQALLNQRAEKSNEKQEIQPVQNKY